MKLAFARLARARAPCIRSVRTFSTTATRFQSPVHSIPYTESCPAPTCACASTPADLDIDRKTPLLNTMAPYAEQVLICTGKEDWTSKLEDEGGATGEFVKGLKGVIGKGGPAFDPFTNILVTASSLPASPSPETSTTAYLLPSFLRIPNIPHTPTAFTALASAYLKPTSLHPLHAALSPTQKAALLRDASQSALLPPAETITHPLILICGHGGRDARCGVLGPLLQRAFRAELKRRGIAAEVAQISHIGGHKFAGNVVVYVPGGWRARARARAEGEGEESGVSALQGCGIWYGRVGPAQVEGLVEETLVRGRVVGELLRGGVVRGAAGAGAAGGGDIGRRIEAQRRAARARAGA
ncbi:Leucine--tRNA ligase [Ascochyta rabiei]|uniref:Leucine--tRNA ligase n=1 Tax=Didymella rabiei TaxID=5454 RepID=UPI00220772F1|nr:Leucine--tRNA ligase [Ascochyta rabiei]UPX18360.1 Leucine--tRNA ligase [Ascochyta rabiei]